MRRLRGRPGNHGGDCDDDLGVLWHAGCRTLTPRGQMSCATSGAPTGTGSGADCVRC
jgi:hypothetical protein